MDIATVSSRDTLNTVCVQPTHGKCFLLFNPLFLFNLGGKFQNHKSLKVSY